MVLAVDVYTDTGDGRAQRWSWPQGGAANCVGAPSSCQCCRAEARRAGLHHMSHASGTHLSIALCPNLQHTQPTLAVLGRCGGWVSPEPLCLHADQHVLKCLGKRIIEKRKSISCLDLAPYDYFGSCVRFLLAPWLLLDVDTVMEVQGGGSYLLLGWDQMLLALKKINMNSLNMQLFPSCLVGLCQSL